MDSYTWAVVVTVGGGIFLMVLGLIMGRIEGDTFEYAPLILVGALMFICGMLTVVLANQVYNITEREEVKEGEEGEEVVLEEVEGEIGEIVLMEDVSGLGEGEVLVEYKVDQDGVTYKREAVINENDISKGEEIKVVEEYVKTNDGKERNGELDELIIKEEVNK